MLREKYISIIYDGDCPFCRNYCKLTRLRDAYGKVELINAREKSRLITEIHAKGYDLNEGMVVKFNGQIYYGSEAINILALLSSRSTIFNKLTAFLFSSKQVSTFIYPVLKACRNCTLFILGRPPIEHSLD